MIPRCVGARTRSYAAMEGVCPPPQGPSLQSGLCCPVLHRLIGPIRPTRGHIAISPQSGLYAMPSLCGSAEATHEWFRAFTIIPSWHAVLFDPGELGHRSVQYRDADTGLRRELSGSALPNTPQSVSRGSWFSWLYGSHLLQPAKLLAPRYGSDRIAPRSTVQAFNESVALPVVGYDYDSLSGLLLSAGLAPAGMIASFAAPTPTSYAARAGLKAVNALTFEVDPSVGAGHNSFASS